MKTRIVLVTLVAGVIAGALGAQSSAHVRFGDGTFTYRYFTYPQNYTGCNDGHKHRIDPLNIIFYQYGEGDRIYSHISNETHWGGFYNSFHDPQDICGTTDEASWSPEQSFQEQEGHGCIEYPWCWQARAHLRLFYAPHGHSALQDKWTVSDVHHEELVNTCSPGFCYDHIIDEDWEKWERHLSHEMSTHHNLYYDFYLRTAPGYPQGYYDDGQVTRVGGLHDGCYDCG